MKYNRGNLPLWFTQNCINIVLKEGGNGLLDNCFGIHCKLIVIYAKFMYYSNFNLLHYKL